MAVDSVNSDAGIPSTTIRNESSGSSETNPSSTTKKVDPSTESDVLNAAVESFLPSMVSNTLMLNNSLFNFAKEAIDEGDEG